MTSRFVLFTHMAGPFALAFLALSLHLLPLGEFFLLPAQPHFLLLISFYLAVFKAENFSPLLVFVCGLALDLYGTSPLGMHALSLLVIYGITLGLRRFLIAAPFLMLWVYFALIACFFSAMHWGIQSLAYRDIVPVYPLLLEFCFNIGLFPIFAGIINLFTSSRAG